MFTDILTITLDFTLTPAEVDAWAYTYAPSCTYAVVSEEPAFTTVRLSGTADALWGAASAWAGGDEDAASEVLDLAV